MVFPRKSSPGSSRPREDYGISAAAVAAALAARCAAVAAIAALCLGFLLLAAFAASTIDLFQFKFVQVTHWSSPLVVEGMLALLFHGGHQPYARQELTRKEGDFFANFNVALRRR